ARELFRSANNVFGEASALMWLARDALDRAPGSDESRTLFEEALSRYRESDVPAGAAWCLTVLAEIALKVEDDALARQRAEEAVRLGRPNHLRPGRAHGPRRLPRPRS